MATISEKTIKQKPRSIQSIKFLDVVQSYLPEDQMIFIVSALDFAIEAHSGQRRKSGEPYVHHPIATALYLANIKLDATTIAAALLHDVLEDTATSKQVLEKKFGADVTLLVDGVTKLRVLDHFSEQSEKNTPIPKSPEAAQAASLRKMLVAMASDIRVVLIKLADRLHNMKTLKYLPALHQLRIARETMEIYAPLSQRLGMNDIKWQLEDEAFKYLNPTDYKYVSRLIKRKRIERENYTNTAINELYNKLSSSSISASITGRPKHLYSTHQKMKRYEKIGRNFDEIYDLIALRVVVESIGDCYSALGVVHQIWRPVPGEFDDYVANPKENLYQSLHTSVVGLDGYPIEVQIRTKDMHRVAEDGVAAHWTYKITDSTVKDPLSNEKLTWLKQLLEWQREMSGDQEYLESVKADILRDQVFVYTPAGEVKDLPTGSTPLDFAYRIHTELGHHTVSALVNGRMVALNTKLNNGDTVEISRTSKSRGPSLDWVNENLGYLATSSARSKVRHWFRKQERQINVDRGHEVINKELKRLGVTYAKEDIAVELGFKNTDDMAEELGTGHLSLHKILKTIIEKVRDDNTRSPGKLQTGLSKTGGTGIVVMGTPKVLTRLARCCRPIYGDKIVGYITKNSSVTAHRTDCSTLRVSNDPDRIVSIAWGHIEGNFPARIAINGYDRVGLLRDITNVVSSEHVNIHSIASKEDPSTNSCTVTLTVYTTGMDQLSRLFSILESLPGIQSIDRVDKN